MEKYKVLKLSKEVLEDSIAGLSQIKPVLQKQCLAVNLDGKGKEDAKELGEHYETAINAMITVLGLMESENVLCEDIPEEAKEKILKEEWIVELTESNSEIWSSDIDCYSREEAIEEGMKTAKEEGLSSFRIGRQEYCSMATIDAGTIIENAQEQLYEEIGEVSETYLEGVTKEQEKELEEALNEAFHSWHKKHKLFPNCYKIHNDEVIEVR